MISKKDNVGQPILSISDVAKHYPIEKGLFKGWLATLGPWMVLALIFFLAKLSG